MQDILKYQDVDYKIKKIEGEILSSESRQNAGKMQQYLKDSQNKIMQLENSSGKVVETYKKATKLYNDFVDKLSELNKKIEGSTLENIDGLKELVSKYYDILSKLEREISSLSNQINNINKDFDNVMKNARTARKNLEVYKEEYSKLKSSKEPEIAALKKELENLKAKVNPELLKKYLAKKEGKFPVFVPEKDGRCGGCRMEIPGSKLNELTSGGHIECENCGRVIYKK